MQMKSLAAAGLFSFLGLISCATAVLAQGDVQRGLYLVEGGGLRRLPYAADEGSQGGGALCRRARAEDAFRHLLRAEHHAASGRRHRQVERGRLHSRHARRTPARRCALLPGLPLSVIHRHHRRRLARSVGLSALPAAERARESGARARHPLSLAFSRRLLEVAVLHARPDGAGSQAHAGSQSRRLPGATRSDIAANAIRRAISWEA